MCALALVTWYCWRRGSKSRTARPGDSPDGNGTEENGTEDDTTSVDVLLDHTETPNEVSDTDTLLEETLV